jgi:uncharacterized protein YvpB
VSPGAAGSPARILLIERSFSPQSLQDQRNRGLVPLGAPCPLSGQFWSKPEVEMNILTVPYVSQILPGALQHNNDCGAASTLMVLNAYNTAKDLTVDKFYDKMYPSGDLSLSASQLMAMLTTYKVKNKWMADMLIHDLFDILVEKRTAIPLIHYAPLVKAKLTEKTNFLGAHFVVLVGMDINNICINDPYSTGSGAGLEIPIEIFKQAWAQCSLDGNPNNCALATTIPIQDLSVPIPPPVGVMYGFNVYNGTLINGINVRSGPASYNTLVKTIWRAETPIVYITQISGEWGRLADESGWVYMPYLKKAEG